MNARNKALFQIHLSTLIFGSSAVVAKLIESTSEVIVFGRGFFAFIALSLFFIFRWKKIPFLGMEKKTIFISLLIGALLAAHWQAFFLGVKAGGVAIGILGFAGFPVFVTLIEIIFLKERPKFLELILVCTVFIGLVLVTPSFSFADKGTVGLIFGVLSGLLYAIIAILNRVGIKNVTPSQTCWWQYLGLMLVILPFCAGQLPSVDKLDWVYIAWMGVMSTGLAYNLFIQSLGVLKASTASMITALEPIYAILLAYLIFSDVPSFRMLLGGSIIITSVILAGRQK